MMPDRFEIGVAGVTFEGRQPKLQRLHAAAQAGGRLVARLEPEPTNPFDRNTIKVLIGVQGGVKPDHVGYVPKVVAKQLSGRLRAGEVLEIVEARVIRGGDLLGETYGARVVVEVREPAPVQPEDRGGF